MKKLLIGLSLSAALFLAACGGGAEETTDETTSANATEQPQESGEDLSQSEWMAQNHPDIMEDTPKVTDDPIEFADFSNELNTYLEGMNEYTIVEQYTSDESDESGLQTVSFNAYDFTFSVSAAEDDQGEEYLVVSGETENNTEDTVQFNADIQFITDTQEQTEVSYAAGESEPTVKQKVFLYAPLEYGVPSSFTVTIEPPFKSVGDNRYEEGHYGEPVELEFNKEQ